jgi:hypothetical protein
MFVADKEAERKVTEQEGNELADKVFCFSLKRAHYVVELHVFRSVLENRKQH